MSLQAFFGLARAIGGVSSKLFSGCPGRYKRRPPDAVTSEPNLYKEPIGGGTYCSPAQPTAEAPVSDIVTAINQDQPAK
ncbi:hypothetical protein WJX73_003324 [Symbiochloris irregularis]|uniref:Uncharacterized protein n=1 Tax=Symbiochloris irregularis TaxID=706552 RepID=A0AAW1P1G4_9CHLO